MTAPCVLLALGACGPSPDAGTQPWSSPTTTSGTPPTEPPVVITEIDPLTDLPAVAGACRDPLLVVVDEGVDGDTVWADPIEAGPLELVRLIGFDSPEVGWDGDPSDCWGDEAQAYTRSALEGGVVWLTFDRDCIDPYDRTLAYVHTGVDEGGFFNEQAVRDGNGRTMTIEPNSAFEDVLRAAEEEAQREGLGMWTCP